MKENESRAGRQTQRLERRARWNSRAQIGGELMRMRRKILAAQWHTGLQTQRLER